MIIMIFAEWLSLNPCHVFFLHQRQGWMTFPFCKDPSTPHSSLVLMEFYMIFFSNYIEIRRASRRPGRWAWRSTEASSWVEHISGCRKGASKHLGNWVLRGRGRRVPEVDHSIRCYADVPASFFVGFPVEKFTPGGGHMQVRKNCGVGISIFGLGGRSRWIPHMPFVRWIADGARINVDETDQCDRQYCSAADCGSNHDGTPPSAPQMTFHM